MMSSPFDAACPIPGSGFDSLDCLDLVFNVRGGQTRRPLEGKMLERALAERERLAKLMEQLAKEKDNGDSASQ
jgi:hypothetical protein